MSKAQATAAKAAKAMKDDPLDAESNEERATRLVKQRMQKLEVQFRVTRDRLERHARYLTPEQRESVRAFLTRETDALLWAIRARGPQEATFDFDASENGAGEDED